MWIEVHFHGGTDIQEACNRACALANRIRCDVHFKFNDVTCMALQNGDPDVLAENWRLAADRGGMYPMASTNPRR
jgi:hypothetical protein